MRAIKILKYLSILLLLVITLFIVYHGPVYTYRVFVWQEADYDDFTRFTTKPISKGSDQYNFQTGSLSQEIKVKEAFAAHPLISDIDSFNIDQYTYAFIVIRNDTILFENYYHDNRREDIQTSFSTAKSVLSLLIGKAIQERKINSINDPITQYLPELKNRDPEFEKISIRDLLRMRSGIKFERGVDFPFVNSDEPLTYSHPDLRYVALNKTSISTAPNKRFVYNDYNALLIGLILERAVGTSVSSYLEQELWQPIGAEYDASWTSDENYFEQMQSGINARPIDFAKIGKLVLDEGDWSGAQLLDSAWISRSTQPLDTMTFRSGQQWAYSHFWWNVLRPNGNNHIFACGNMGQFIYTDPSSNSIIIRHGLESDDLDDDDWTDIFSFYLSQQ